MTTSFRFPISVFLIELSLCLVWAFRFSNAFVPSTTTTTTTTIYKSAIAPPSRHSLFLTLARPFPKRLKTRSFYVQSQIIDNQNSGSRQNNSKINNGDNKTIQNNSSSNNNNDSELRQTTSSTTFQYQGRINERSPSFRCGYISLIGAPNMGKSTLLNALIKQDLCITTPRPQTTRHAILGILTTGTCQLCFTDTPGVITSPSYKLQEGMMEAVQGAVRDADVLLVVTDLFSTPIPDDALFEKVRVSNKPVVVAVNKVDLEGKLKIQNDNESKHCDNDKKESEEEDEDEAQQQRTVTIPDAVAKWRSLLPHALAIIPLSASSGPDDVGVTALRTLLMGGPDDVPKAFRDLGRPIPGMFRPGVKFVTNDEARGLLPLSPPLYDEDALTDRTERFFASEIIRASLFRKLGKELPYCCEVRVTEFKEPKETDNKPTIRMKATIYVERESQKGIVVGKGGNKIKDVGMDARVNLEEFFQTKVHLDLNVKVDKDWRRDEGKLKLYGYLK